VLFKKFNMCCFNCPNLTSSLNEDRSSNWRYEFYCKVEIREGGVAESISEGTKRKINSHIRSNCVQETVREMREMKDRDRERRKKCLKKIKGEATMVV
jgi:hypothetical protein